MGEPCRIRAASSADVAAMAAIERQCFSDPWSARSFREMLDADDTFGLIMETPAAGVIGYLLARSVTDEAEILNLAIRPDHRRRGLARRLLSRGLDEIRARGGLSVFLEVRTSNEAGRELYGAAGFTPVGRRRAYYQRPVEDAIVLRRALSRSAK